jgi:hypothetical protein
MVRGILSREREIFSDEIRQRIRREKDGQLEREKERFDGEIQQRFHRERLSGKKNKEREEERQGGFFVLASTLMNTIQQSEPRKSPTPTNKKPIFPPQTGSESSKITHHSIPKKILERERIPGSWITPETRNTNSLLDKDGRERCGPVETTLVKDDRPAREERERERERERRVGRENEKIYPSQHVLAF